MVHKPKHKVHSFRGLLGDDGQDEINLERQNLNLAYRIVKFELLPAIPGIQDYENIVKVYREEQTSITGTIDFNEVDLLAAAYLSGNKATTASDYLNVIFDNTLFSRNISVTHSDVSTNAQSCNYYIELEEVPVGAATLMQLKLGVARKLNLSQDPVVT